MSNPTEQRDAARQRAQNYFTQTEKRDALVKEEVQKERALLEARTAKLRALRLAREESEREAAIKAGPVATAKPRRKRAVKS